ncbi:hypothetical protein CROQUDRAFT_671026 [Cronartium quercuum f. sp. fusiforme G11]|uniref:mRNA export factor GLE1 n=1 Tax=Cronartium quercuum f. sp. fusiforme G11 TaxID=708437 RepID=A0A9P6NM85_9BASI|nr:hypothetical protein CROQUDRAFT_671026 [Cronartium quercuum f. sp. fusiforme G11]
MKFRVPDTSDEDSASDEQLSRPHVEPSFVKSPFNDRFSQSERSPAKKPPRSQTLTDPSLKSSGVLSQSLNQNSLRRSTLGSKLGSSQLGRKTKYNGPYCAASPVPRNDHTPSPFANPPVRPKSASNTLGSSLRIRLEDLSASSEEEEEEDDDAIDSEEEQWPIRRRRRLIEDEEAEEQEDVQQPNGPTYLVPDDDALQVWDQQGRQSTYQLSMRKALERRKHFEQIHARTLATARESHQREHAKNMNELSEILNRIGLDKEREVRLIAEGFEKREQLRAKAFEAMIAEAEKIEAEEALRLARLKQEEAARKADLERQEAQKKSELEERKRKAVELKLQQEQQRQAQEAKKKKEADLIRETEAQTCHELKIVKDNYDKWNHAMQQIKQNVLPAVSSNESYKSLCRQAKRKITPKVGQLTMSSKKIENVIMELGDVLQQTKAENRDVYIWSCNHLAKALIKQAETEVTAKLGTVYPLARVVIGLILVGYVELGDVLMARMVKKCYFVAAYRPLPLPGQSKEDYRKQLGYLPETAQEETSVQHGTRMAGILALYAALCQTDPLDVVPSLRGQVTPEQVKRIPPQLRLDSCWTWFSHILKLPIVQFQSTPKLLSTFIEVAGERMHQVYGRQWLKLMAVLLVEGIRKQKASFDWDNCKPTIVQLEAILEDIERKGRHKPSEGRSYVVDRF